MALVQTLVWRPHNPAAVCLSQNVAAGSSFLINGEETNVIPYASSGVWQIIRLQRTFTITTALTTDLSGVNFTVTGSVGGYPRSETISGPILGAGTKESTLQFDTITNVSVDTNVVGVSIGTGTHGRTGWTLYDNFVPFSALSVQIDSTDTSLTARYTFQSTLRDASNVPQMEALIALGLGVTDGIIMPNPASPNAYILALDNVGTVSVSATLMYPTRYYSVLLNEGTDPDGAEITVCFEQQGVRS